MSTDDSDDTMRMTDMTIEETSLAESRRPTLSESTIMQTSEMDVTETNGRPEEAEDITETSEIFEETIPIKWRSWLFVIVAKRKITAENIERNN